MRHRFLQAILVVLFPVTLIAQPAVPADEEHLPKDYLPASFHAGRRAALREIMPDNSVVVVFAYPTRTFSNDVEYLFHQNPDMYYFSGYKEPHSMLLIFKDEQTDSAGGKFTELLFVQRKDPRAEQWTGKRLGAEGAQQKLGIRMSLNAAAFQSFNIDFSKFDKVIFDAFPIDVPNNRMDNADLYDLIRTFKEKAAIPEDISKEKRFDQRAFRTLTGKLREIKTDEEMVLLRKAVEISCQGHNEVMKAVHPNMSELEIQGLQEFIHKKYGAEHVGYGSIIGSGENGCTLHYEINNKTKIGNSLVLMDVGAEYHGYTADVTRTIPASGKFSDTEKAIYQLVYDAQEAAFRLLKDGCKWSEINSAARETITTGLIKLGVAKNVEEANKYYPHGLGHHIGMDVHDRGSYGELRKGMVITIEPGIYIPSGSNCDKKWWGIAVRIEDDALITENGYELLSVMAPRKIEEIEKMIARQSALDDLKLPPLKSGEKRGF
ncbi:MAG TPA: aminopeptidase P N-terminal domain-containing protein [Chitinophagaceae bacterium]|nr:aminopeptidase P N-terminal domain-containing protein [Chitinophagaceae bacterium]